MRATALEPPEGGLTNDTDPDGGLTVVACVAVVTGGAAVEEGVGFVVALADGPEVGAVVFGLTVVVVVVVVVGGSVTGLYFVMKSRET